MVRPSDDDGLIEIKCPNGRCKQQDWVVVFHIFRTSDGSLVETRRYREPGKG